MRVSSADSEQIRHDRVNLVRLVKRLETTADSKEWQEEMRKPSRTTWIKTQSMLQKLKFARKLLKTLELHDALEDSSTSTRFDEYENTIGRLEAAASEAHKRATPQSRRPRPILPTLPLPVLSVPTVAPELTQDVAVEIYSEESSAPVAEASQLSRKATMLAAPAVRPPLDPTSSLLPASAPRTSDRLSNPSGTPAFLQNSASLQDEMADQILQMATQLKRNAIQLGTSLEEDKSIVKEAEDKMGHNFDVMSTARVRLRDHRGKSWGTTWLVLLSMLVAVIGFVLTFFVIRIT
ncbi:hypothetical protein BC835DRAFT_1551159 [Cytidiella melzeri]|nr:hypothetical protein BC835DRAFT_1551159 [Cytidiella melzeri]